MLSFLLFAAAGVSLPCEKLPEPQATQCGLALHQFICWTTESEAIRNDDPAILIFLNDDESLEDAKIELADERVNGCDPQPERIA